MSAVIRRIINTCKAPSPVGPYSQAVVVDKTMYISGQVGLVPGTGQLIDGGLEAETTQTLENLKGVCEAAGVTLSNVVKTTVLLHDINDWPAVNVIYSKCDQSHGMKQVFSRHQDFTSHPPARAAFQVAALPKGALVEIEAVAVLGTVQDVE